MGCHGLVVSETSWKTKPRVCVGDEKLWAEPAGRENYTHTEFKTSARTEQQATNCEIFKVGASDVLCILVFESDESK